MGRNNIKRLAIIILLLQIFCGIVGGTAFAKNINGPENNVAINLSGSIIDGPVIGATLNIYNKNGVLINSVNGDGSGGYNTTIKAVSSGYPLTIEVIGGTDTVTGRAPDFTMKSVVISSSVTRVNINPFTTLIVDTATSMPGGLTSDNISRARSFIVNYMNFGLDQDFIKDPIRSEITSTNIAVMVKSSEVLGEMIRRARDRLKTVGATTNADEVIVALADDMTDGVLDGIGTSRANKRVAAISELVSGQVLIEALSNNLKVNGVNATSALDNAIVTIKPGTGSSGLTSYVRTNKKQLKQAIVSIEAARALLPSAELGAIANVLSKIGEETLPSKIAPILPPSRSDDLNVVIDKALYASDTELDQINGAVRILQKWPATDGNSLPVLFGVPSATAVTNTLYQFQPGAADIDGDTLTFTIENLPAWASFDTNTGLLSGTPINSNVGIYANIIITVSDGKASVSFPVFSITVTATSGTNTPPVISGTPISAVYENTFYIFAPSYNDADGDTLTFSIVNQPTWASFNTTTGALTGTPGNSDVGTTNSIQISVTDGFSNPVSLPVFNITVESTTAVLTWQPPITRIDSSPLALSEIGGYKIYTGTDPGNLVLLIDINASVTEYTITNLTPATHYYAITAYDLLGLESDFSNIVSKTINHL